MNAIDVELLEAVCAALGQVPGVRAVRVKAPKQKVEIPLSRYVAVVVEPTGVEALTWPDVPVSRYHLLHWRAAVLDRALPGTAAFKALASVADACRNALASDLSLGGLAEDGPPSARNGLAPEVGATRIAPVELGDSEPGGPTALLFNGASGYWEGEMVGAATLDDEMLFSSGGARHRGRQPRPSHQGPGVQRPGGRLGGGPGRGPARNPADGRAVGRIGRRPCAVGIGRRSVR